MASSEKKICTLCYDDDGSSRDAVTWCTECEVFLCKDCGKHHKKSKTSKDHKTMPTEDYHQLTNFILDISSQCRDHKKKFELYCPFHACPCCVQCIIYRHNKCQDKKPLSDILQQVKSSASVQLLEKDLKDLQENFEEITKYLNSRIETSNIQKQKAAEKIRSMRNSIDDYLNKIEKKILDDLESKQSNIKSEINTLLQQLTQRANEISQLQSEFSKMTKYATELQMYFGLGEIEKATTHAAKYIEDLTGGGPFDENNLEVTISSKLQSILKDVKSFGDIHINTSPFTIKVKAGRKDQAQYLARTIPRLEQIKPSLFRLLSIPKNIQPFDILACKILPTGEYLILKSHIGQSLLVLFSNYGMFLKTVVTFNELALDACFVRTNTVAVTLGSKNQTTLVDVEQDEIIKTIDLSNKCGSVASDGQILIISSVGEKSTVVNLKDMSHTILEGVLADRVALFKGNIYCANYMENKVCCYKSTGEPIWTFKHHAIDKPGGITLDQNGFVYTVSQENYSIVVVSPDGKTCKTILSKADGIKFPFAIDINRETGMMIVSSKRRDGRKSYDKPYETAYVYAI